MSALDQAFIKAYSKESGLARPSATAQAVRRAGPQVASASATQNEPARVHLEDPYLAGHWYRLDAQEAVSTEPASGSDEPAADTKGAAANLAPQRKRLVARKPHVRFRAAAETLPAQQLKRNEPKQDQPIPSATIKGERPASAAHLAAPVSLDSFSPVFAVGYADDWDSHAALPVGVEAEAQCWSPETALAVQSIVEPPAVPSRVSPTILRTDAPAAAVSKPHFPLPSPVHEEPTRPSEPVAASTLEANSAQPADRAATIDAVLTEQSAVEPEPETSVPAPIDQQPSAEPFDPAWEVERFFWPTTCDELLTSSPDDWEGAARQLLDAAKQGCKVVAVAGLRRGEGRSTLALCLARLAAESGAKVALVDADFEHPQLSELLGVGAECDWREALAEGLPLAEAAILGLADGLTLLPLQSAAAISEISFGQPAVVKMLRDASKFFDLVLVDAGPLAGPEHAARWGGKSCPFDGGLFVRDLRRTDAEEAAATVGQLRKNGLSHVVVVENFAP
jgi:Mrp family chromosome partitioning ATPase